MVVLRKKMRSREILNIFEFYRYIYMYVSTRATLSRVFRLYLNIEISERTEAYNRFSSV